jgi:hypothetical protein
MSLRAIGSALEVDEKTVRKALRNAPHAERQATASGRHASCTAGSSGRPARRATAAAVAIDQDVASVELLNVDLAAVRIGEERRRKEPKKTEVG